MTKLSEELPREFLSGSYDETAAYKLRDQVVVAKHDARNVAWPGVHKNITYWYELDNGKAVGFNENPARGWSFPVITLKRS